MAGLANPPGYGSNRWGEVAWAQRNAIMGPRFRVKNSGSWLPTVSTSINRTVNIAAGAGDACGVYDETDTAESVTVAANTTGSDRFDFIVAQFDWATRTRTFQVIQGTVGTPALPNINRTGSVLAAGQVNWVPGLRYDGVIAWVRIPPNATLLQPGFLGDMRLWGGSSGPVVSNSQGNFNLVDLPPYGEVIVAGTGKVWRRSNETTTYTEVISGGGGTTPVARTILTPSTGFAQSNVALQAQSWRDSNGIVHVTGGLVNTAAYLPNGDTAAVLPAAHRPSRPLNFGVTLNNQGAGIRIEGGLQTDGRLQFTRGSTSIASGIYHSFSFFFPGS